MKLSPYVVSDDLLVVVCYGSGSPPFEIVFRIVLNLHVSRL